jgi:ABC-type uncharacterized transport system substrate-binding protein
VITSDPVGDGFIASLARPGGNITGLINAEATMGGKWLELLKEAAPKVLPQTAIDLCSHSQIARPYYPYHV